MDVNKNPEKKKRFENRDDVLSQESGSLEDLLGTGSTGEQDGIESLATKIARTQFNQRINVKILKSFDDLYKKAGKTLPAGTTLEKCVFFENIMKLGIEAFKSKYQLTD